MSKKIQVNVGEKFNRLTIIKEVEPTTKRKGTRVLCICECGKQIETLYESVRRGNTKSCGCYQRDMVKLKNTKDTTQRLNHLSTYRSWSAMKSRCSNKKLDKYKDYGGRGIKVHTEWIKSFDKFLSDVGARPEGKTLDRIDNDGNYEPGNVRWASPYEQVHNRRNIKELEIEISTLKKEIEILRKENKLLTNK